MEFLSPMAATTYLPNPNWLLTQRKSTSGYWTQQENKLFENALAFIDVNSPNGWEKVAAMIPGKTAADVLYHYRDLVEDIDQIEAGHIPFPGYSSSFMLDWEGSMKQSGKKDQERKKGVPWTEDEHRLFLMGLDKYGKGDWRNISRHYVVSRTPTQVASHAQKYFIRISSVGKDKRRSSIHDITAINLPDHQSGISIQANSLVVDSNKNNEARRNSFVQQQHYRMKSQAQNLHRGKILHDSIIGQHSMLF